MKVLVTGGAGFIGSHVVDIFIENGYDVSVVDNLSTGHRKNVNPKAIFYEVDLADSEALAEVFEKEKPDYVLHIGGQVNVRKSVNDPVGDLKTNILGTLNIVECCRRFAVKKMVYASSSGVVYGEPKKIPVSENDPLNPICPYGASKLSAEFYIKVYAFLYNLDYVILRYSNVYGPRQDPDGEAGVMCIFADKMLKGKEVVIFGDGTQTRDFVYVWDVARANLMAVEKESSSKIFNLGTGTQITINKVYEELSRIIKKPHKKRNDPPIQGEIKNIYSDISLIKKELGWKPEMGLAEGLAKTVEFIKKG